MHPTLIEVGPWQAIHVPLIFLFFLAIVALWTWLERRGEEGGLRLTALVIGEILLQAAVPAVITYFIVNRIGPLMVRSYGVMMLLAFAAGLAWMYRDRDRYRFTGPQVLQVGLIGFAGGIVGGRLGFVLLNLSDYSGDPASVFDLWRGGMSWHGGLAGSLLVLAIASPLIGVSFARVFDLGAPGIAIGYAIARIGCFVNGCCYGHRCDLPWAVTFPQSGTATSPAFPSHPTQLYSVIGTLAFTLPLLLWMTPWLRKPFDRLLAFLALYSVVRYVVEIFRRGATGEVWEPLPVLTMAQAASVAIFVIAAAIVIAREWPFRREERS